MTTRNILLEVVRPMQTAFGLFGESLTSSKESVRQAEDVLSDLAGFGIELSDELPPVPMFSISEKLGESRRQAFGAFESREINLDETADSLVVSAYANDAEIERLSARKNVRVWENSPITLFANAPRATLPSPTSDQRVPDCNFAEVASIKEIQALLGIDQFHARGIDGDNMVIGVLDEGVNNRYRVSGGFAVQGAQQPGSASIHSHGSMCAADALIAAPKAKIYDYPFLGVPNSGGALRMFQAVLSQRRQDGTPHITTNSYGYTFVPPRAASPRHEIYDLQHPLHRKVREVIASGAPVFFAAGNCGSPCPSGNCHTSSIGPGQSIHASNSLEEVITVAAVNKKNVRIGYSSQGPGMFEREKPDIAAYSHIYGNFGPGRPGGTAHEPFDSGTSAATPLAAGVATLLLQKFPRLSPAQLKSTLIAAAGGGANNWNADIGYGIIDAEMASDLLDST